MPWTVPDLKLRDKPVTLGRRDLRFIDITGQKFYRLTALNVASRCGKVNGVSKDTMWLCQCECGGEKIASLSNLKKGYVKSCGCHRKTTNGAYKHRLWLRWNSMIARCSNPDNEDFKNYGGRGISVCDRWQKFELFLEDMEATFFEGASLERVDNDDGYRPENCKWVPRSQQAWNRRDTPLIDTPWGRMSRGEAAQRSGMSSSLIASRLKLGWSTERLFDPKNRGRQNRWSNR